MKLLKLLYQISYSQCFSAINAYSQMKMIPWKFWSQNDCHISLSNTTSSPPKTIPKWEDEKMLQHVLPKNISPLVHYPLISSLFFLFFQIFWSFNRHPVHASILHQLIAFSDTPQYWIFNEISQKWRKIQLRRNHQEKDGTRGSTDLPIIPPIIWDGRSNIGKLNHNFWDSKLLLMVLIIQKCH